MASRRKRGPVAFRARLSAGLALSLLSNKRSTNWRNCLAVNVIQNGRATYKRPIHQPVAPAVLPVSELSRRSLYTGIEFQQRACRLCRFE